MTDRHDWIRTRLPQTQCSRPGFPVRPRSRRKLEGGTGLRGPTTNSRRSGVARAGGSEKQLQWQMALTVFLVATFVFALSPVVTNYDSFATLPTAVSIVNRHTLSLNAYQHVKVLTHELHRRSHQGPSPDELPVDSGIVRRSRRGRHRSGPRLRRALRRFHRHRTIAHRPSGPAVDRLGRHRIGLRRPDPSRLPAVTGPGTDTPSLGHALWPRLRLRHERLVHRVEGALGTRAVHPVHRGRPSRPRPPLPTGHGGSCVRDEFGLAAPSRGTDPRRGGDRASDQRRRPGIGDDPGALEDLHPTCGPPTSSASSPSWSPGRSSRCMPTGRRCSPTPWRTSSASPRRSSNPWRPS